LWPFPAQSTPNLELPSLTCLLLTSAKVSIGANPEFSAKAKGIASNAVANALMAYCSIEGISSAAFETAIEQAISAAPPP